MIKATEVRELMNRYGAERVPFLFAVDFELEKGIFELNPLEILSLASLMTFLIINFLIIFFLGIIRNS
jgi:hypothetical protein